MINKIHLWIGGKTKMCTRAILGMLSGLIALILALYGALTSSLRQSTKWFFNFLPFVHSYNMAMEALKKLTGQLSNESYGISKKIGTLKRGDIGYSEFVRILNDKGWVKGEPDEIIYEELEQPLNYTLIGDVDMRLDTSLKIKTGMDVKVISENDPYDPTKIIRDLISEIRDKLLDRIGNITVIGSTLLFLLLIAISIVNR
jgi:hypothetical protein